MGHLPCQVMVVLITFLLNALKKIIQAGLVVEAEQDPAKANPFEYAKIGFNYLSKNCKTMWF